MTGWRCATIVGNAEAIALYWRLKSNIDSGLFEAVQLAGVAALQPEVDQEVADMNAVYERRRDLVCAALTEAGVNVTPPKGRSTSGRRSRPGSSPRRLLRVRARADRRGDLAGGAMERAARATSGSP